MPSGIRVRDIRKEQLGDQLFFFDSNVWLFIFNQSINQNSAAFHYGAPYVKFWEKITQAVTKPGDPDPTATVVERPVAAISSLVVTETLNAHLRKGFKTFKETLRRKGGLTSAQIDALDYKQDFRDKEPRYRTLFELCQAEFEVAARYLKVVTGDKLDQNILQMLSGTTHTQDFNDRYYAELCKQHELILVTHDSDFAVPGITVVTANATLLAKSTSGAIAKNKPNKALWNR